MAFGWIRKSIDQNLVFVVSSPRSGSTWLKQSLNCHPQIHCTENRFFGPHFDVVLDGAAKVPRLRITTDAYVEALFKSLTTDQWGVRREEAQQQFTRALASTILQLERRLSKRPIVVDKFTPYVGTAHTAIAQLARTFPRARFIHLVRDGRDVATSGVFHWLTKQLDGVDVNQHVARRRKVFVERSTATALDRFFTDEELHEWTQTWSDPNGAMVQLAKDTNVDSLVVRYEDMLEDHERELRRVFHFLGAKSTDAIIRRCVESSSFQKMSGGRNRGEADPTAHVRKGIAGDWRNYFCRQDAETFDRLAGELLLTMGYEKKRTWGRDLPNSLDIRTDKAA